MTTPINVEELLRNRVKFIGDGEWTLLGTPNDVIKELENLITNKLIEELDILLIGNLDYNDFVHRVIKRIATLRATLSNTIEGE